MRQSKTGRWRVPLAVLLGLLVLFWFLLTSAEPWAPARRAPTAEQVQVARAALHQLDVGRAAGVPSRVRLGNADLDGISALATRGFAPNRVDVRVKGDRAAATLSRPVLGRWLNLRAEAAGRSRGFPELRVTVGAITLPAWASHLALRAARRLAIIQGAKLPPLDALVRATSIDGNMVQARIWMPPSGLLRRVVAPGAAALDDAAVARIYCHLAKGQRRRPDPSFAGQVRRAVAAAGPAPAEQGAALVALAMFVVGPEAGALVGDAYAKTVPCLVSPPEVTLHGRADLPKHWSLSAALTVTTGGQFAMAMGEWKELADSLSRDPLLAPGDPSGFSFVDLSADRAGFLFATRLSDPNRTASARARLAAATDETLLPRAQLGLEDGMSEAEFTRRFGGTDDPRFLAATRAIDAALGRSGID